jgi:hypothetical protein
MVSFGQPIKTRHSPGSSREPCAGEDRWHSNGQSEADSPAVFLESCRGRKRGRLAVRRSQQQRLFGEQRLHALEVAGQESSYKLAIQLLVADRKK